MKTIKILIIALMMCLTTNVAFGQWTPILEWDGGVTGNDFKREFKGSFKTERNRGGYLVIKADSVEDDEGTVTIAPVLVLKAGYLCDRWVTIDVALVVNGKTKKHQSRARKNISTVWKVGSLSFTVVDNDSYTFAQTIWTDEFIRDFRSATRATITVNQDGGSPLNENLEYCKNDYAYTNPTKTYQFNFAGSAAAYDFVAKD